MARILSALGSAMRSAGQAIDAMGAGVQGKSAYFEKRQFFSNSASQKIENFSGADFDIDGGV